MTSSTNVQTFNTASHGYRNSRPKASPPFSIRFTDEERSRLDRAAGALSLAAYIRLKLFDDDMPRSRRSTKRRRQPSAELAVLSHMLGGLGQSRLASNLNQLAKAANTGTLPLSPEVERELKEACEAVQEMRRDLVAALGVKPEDGS
ncbi:hypothetical protein PB2503_05867 [Parvularcula bermudensis HTCC2503]|uniref:Bacterial mobilisation domain-containing protein n=1 Tax=Parvularcula bermudensis (strain ATCC BAA-594 / HTCC2503 / KCTC 12087) TaxID=314260 RepID=E0TH04_PARBH|nr:plasmid mobilization relaxosome protein MobC [Parvularcula bermudensis]ADM09244.1 hypothetical protein PB2503_05867 [Parvularcula bermudensis HTCC2503]